MTTESDLPSDPQEIYKCEHLKHCEFRAEHCRLCGQRNRNPSRRLHNLFLRHDNESPFILQDVLNEVFEGNGLFGRKIVKNYNWPRGICESCNTKLKHLVCRYMQFLYFNCTTICAQKTANTYFLQILQNNFNTIKRNFFFFCCRRLSELKIPSSIRCF